MTAEQQARDILLEVIRLRTGIAEFVKFCDEHRMGGKKIEELRALRGSVIRPVNGGPK